MTKTEVIETLSPFWKMSVGQEDRKESSSGRFWREFLGLAHVEALGRWASASAQQELDTSALVVRLLDMARVLSLPVKLADGGIEVGDSIVKPGVYTHRIDREGARAL